MSFFKQKERDFRAANSLLEANSIKEEPQEVILELANEFSLSELEILAGGLRLFLFNEEEFNLVDNAKMIINDLLGKYYLR